MSHSLDREIVKDLKEHLKSIDLRSEGSMDQSQFTSVLVESFLIKLHEYLNDKCMSIWVEYLDGDEDADEYRQKALVDLILVNATILKNETSGTLLQKMIREKAFRKEDIAEYYFLTLIRKKINDGIKRHIDGSFEKIAHDVFRDKVIDELLTVFDGRYAHGSRFFIDT